MGRGSIFSGMVGHTGMEGVIGVRSAAFCV